MGDQEALLQKLRKLDSQAITQIHALYYPAVYRYVRYRLGDESLSEDITSEAFVRLLEAFHKGRGPKNSLKGWLIGTASNLVNDHFRNQYNQPIHSLSEQITSSTGNPEHQVDEAARRAMIQSAFARLSPHQQHVLALRFGSGFSLAETAAVMGKTVNAVKQLQFRALVTLRQNMAGEIE